MERKFVIIIIYEFTILRSLLITKISTFGSNEIFSKLQVFTKQIQNSIVVLLIILFGTST